MEKAKSTRGRTNYIGTILYVLGVIDQDIYVGSGEGRWKNGIVDEDWKDPRK